MKFESIENISDYLGEDTLVVDIGADEWWLLP
jgi:hypothetical protein